MPPSSEQDTQPIPVNRGSTHKQPHKGTPPGASTLSKRERKNGLVKESGGLPAVTKSGLKMAETSKASSASTLLNMQSPSITPASTVPASLATTSPLLDALAVNAFNSSTIQNTNEWAINVPAYSGSPGNLISLSSSPPTVPSSCEDRSVLAGWNQRDHRASNGQIPSNSPPTQRWRPLSYQMEGHQNFDDQASQRVDFTKRRSSMYSQQAQRYGVNPPLPHQPQAHFYGVPDPTFGLSSRMSGMKPGSEGYYCGFDSLKLSGVSGSKSSDSVLLSGYEGGLDVFSVTKYNLKRILGIEDLRGGVYAAKILPMAPYGESLHCFPLIAIVLHGPVIHSHETSGDDDTVQAVSEGGSPLINGSVRGHQTKFSPSQQVDNNLGSITHFQTTVEVYSLTTKKRISILLSLPKVPLTSSITSSLFMPPPPSGALSVSADAGNVIIASGLSGEIWMYRQTGHESDRSLGFCSVGKVWTTIQQVRVQEPASPPDFASTNSPFSEASMFRQQQKTALFSLKGRWLAYSPPSSTSAVPLRASIPAVTIHTKAPGVNTFAPPQVPPINCAVDMPEGETLLNRVAREATQAAIKGAKWVGDQGYQAWNSYWNKSTSTTPAYGIGNAAQNFPHPQQEPTYGFPPTHGEALQYTTSNSDPSLVSILDIEKLATVRAASSAIPPLPFATFKAPLGCSFISFSPSGLALFTASGKGEVQFVWDLMRIQYSKSSALQVPHIATLQGQHIRQLAIFTRMTPARIIDVVWTQPHGERIAMVTDRSTVHFWDLPPTAFAWPPLRRRIRAPIPNAPVSSDVIEAPKSATAIATGAVSVAWSLAQPLMKRPRGLSGPGRPSITAASVTAQAGHGGKALAQGISKSFGAATGTIESLYKSGENRLHLPRTHTVLNVGCIKWLDGNQMERMSAVVDGAVMIYTIKRKTNRTDKQQISIGRQPVKIELPRILNPKIPHAILRALDLEDELALTETEADVRVDLNRALTLKSEAASGTESSISQAEIESNAPYQPFHTDRRVNLFVYSTLNSQLRLPSISELLAPQENPPQQPHSLETPATWVFGMPISTTKLDIAPSRSSDEGDSESADDHLALPASAMERVTTKISEADENVEQIVVTTRRRKGVVRSNTGLPSADEDGFFEDDCEVLDFASQRV